ncbi:pyridoxamine 5'-phosphate oxidase family protein [Amycolatopsis sp. K13G38]|uniref:Pyridoxamine 5'-phosphate oxidase family protein n=1 Tax=Amycolatopsis acididurans TaxID=2724524 RepID=A0ABX1JDA8_9PSEU|nr:pyridoxamine 5'-phosphate oxidase family protein [Amycolatopsis acididurans]NKQ57439.1 pyridoxamine 5'-phosphate oxidase family protein [Amycolatopsis acididurans]
MPSTESEVLGVRECLSLLRSVAVGRLVFSAAALPAIRPVTFTIAAGFVVIPDARGSWADKLDRTVVAFEADQIDEATHTGWSVVAVGKAELVGDLDEDVTSMRGRALKVNIERVTGRRLVPVAA